MTRTGRDVTIFVAGIAAWETLGHWIVGLWARDMFPMKIFGMVFTERMNIIAMVLWPILLALMVYLAWFRRRRARGGGEAIRVSV